MTGTINETTEVTVNITEFDNLTKQQMANVIAILMDMDGYEGQLMKLSIPALKKMYEGINKNAMAYDLAKQEVRNMKTELAIAERRSASLERSQQRQAAKKGRN